MDRRTGLPASTTGASKEGNLMSNSLEVENWALWQHRYQALIQTIDDFIAQIGDANDLVVNLLRELRAFGDEQFNLFFYGFHPDAAARNAHNAGKAAGSQVPQLDLSRTYPPDYVLRVTLDQIAVDLTLLQLIWGQRQIKTGPMARTLVIADKLAAAAIRPATPWLREQQPGARPAAAEPVAITYFQKMAAVRTVPYANVALIGIPFTTIADYDAADTPVGNVRDLLAIAHEVGHYVYRHARFNGSTAPAALIDYLQGQPDWLLNWLEEIFADVYGVFVGGPAMVRNFQELMKDNDFARFWLDDGEHPIPALRPYVYTTALQSLKDFDALPDAFDAHIDAVTQAAKEAWAAVLRDTGLERIKPQLAIVTNVVEGIVALFKSGTPDFDLWIGYANAPAETYKNLYREFRDKVKSLDAAAETLAPGNGKLALPAQNSRRPGLLVRKTIKQEAGTIPAELWALTISMNGWAYKGPEEQPDPKVP